MQSTHRESTSESYQSHLPSAGEAVRRLVIHDGTSKFHGAEDDDQVPFIQYASLEARCGLNSL